jgi:hypothetical protein
MLSFITKKGRSRGRGGEGEKGRMEEFDNGRGKNGRME